MLAKIINLFGKTLGICSPIPPRAIGSSSYPKIDLPSPVEAPVYHGPLQAWTSDKTTSQALREPQDQVKREQQVRQAG